MPRPPPAAQERRLLLLRRCRPESAPGTPAWLGPSATVFRALRLIERGVLDEHSVETLAGQLGIGDRYLRRLFDKHLGTSPQYVAMRAFGEPDAFPAGDLILRRAAGKLTEAALEQKSEAWRPWRAYAAIGLWTMYSEEKADGHSALAS